MVQEVEHPGVGPVKSLGNPVKLSRTPAVLRKSAPDPGEDTDAILAELGYTSEAIAGLRSRKVVA
jgi:crotonobetainyl-CoA:carnitine CoA-transferase CaiB-like acyl-CoA transferase